MEAQNSKTLETVAIDWIASVLSSPDTVWSSVRDRYRKGVTPVVDALFSWVDRSWSSSGEVPSYETTQQRWSKMPWPAHVLPEAFSSLELEQAYRRYDLISHVRALDTALSEGTTNEAYKLAIGFVSRANFGTTPTGVDLLDPMLYVDTDIDKLTLNSWGDSAVERPLERSDLVLMAARTGVGKSWFLLLAVIDALSQGWDVVLYSLEMPASQVAKRMRVLLKVDAPKWLSEAPGTLHVIDQTMDTARRGFSSLDIMRRVEQGSRTLIVIDYGELLRPESGGRAQQGHDKSGEISSALQSAAKYLHVPILCAVQDNRQAVGQRPGVETLSGSDQWGRDADLVVRIRDESDAMTSGTTRILEWVKTRHTAAAWPTFIHFDPGGRGIVPIDRMEYTAINAKENV